MSDQSETLADDPFSGRQPTSHERMAGQPWDGSYHNGPAPWDIGQPQPTILRFASEGGFAAAVVAEAALAIAREKAAERRITNPRINVEFAVADALQLERLGRNFKTVLDCGLFHTFDDDERTRYAASLARVTEHGGTLYVLCFSNDGPDTGPHPISQEELSAAFNPSDGWNIVAIEPDRIQTRYHDNGAPAWLATIKRI